MKELYFTDENIGTKAVQMLDSLISDIKTHEIVFEPKNSALLIIDTQNFFIDSASHACIPSANIIIPVIKKLLEIYKKQNLPVIFTKHINTSLNAGLMSLWWKDLITENNDLSRITDTLNSNNSIIIEKPQYDAFYNTSLESILRDKNITQLVITGLVTHLCCETTLRSAFVRGFTTFFPMDATATYNEEFHLASFKNLSHGFTVPVITANILKCLEETI